MNTTMADGAEQRLDAQIAEALFGQPGMSKMDVANRVRELRGDGPALLVPRGQGDARIPFETWAKSQNYDMHRSAGGPTFVVGEYTSELTAGAWEAWQYLAARQPEVK
ncbi:hypothetical protein [Stenotrophomonas maltophilia]|uniref:hypothetical protein n=1 Tax=Stenotrophomonas maltophilia TaxID=40324 RepID=UPI0024027C53|nr:hypothetical protein [Stenotrophomonas maltophilia]